MGFTCWTPWAAKCSEDVCFKFGGFDPSCLPLVLHSINELPERSQAFLTALADVEREDRVWNKADLPDWESHAAREAREFLRLQKSGAALDEDPTLQMSWSVCHILILAPGCPAGA